MNCCCVSQKTENFVLFLSPATKHTQSLQSKYQNEIYLAVLCVFFLFLVKGIAYFKRPLHTKRDYGQHLLVFTSFYPSFDLCSKEKMDKFNPIWIDCFYFTYCFVPNVAFDV